MPSPTFPIRCHGTIRGGSAARGVAAEGDELGTAIVHARAVVANAIADRHPRKIWRRIRT
jgi:hypothetical protein